MRSHVPFIFTITQRHSFGEVLHFKGSVVAVPFSSFSFQTFLVFPLTPFHFRFTSHDTSTIVRVNCLRGNIVLLTEILVEVLRENGIWEIEALRCIAASWNWETECWNLEAACLNLEAACLNLEAANWNTRITPRNREDAFYWNSGSIMEIAWDSPPVYEGIYNIKFIRGLGTDFRIVFIVLHTCEFLHFKTFTFLSIFI